MLLMLFTKPWPQQLAHFDMSFFASVILAVSNWLFPVEMPVPPVIIHHPAPTEFTIDTVKVGAIAKPPVKKSSPVGGTALGALTIDQRLAGEESLYAHIGNGVVDAVIVISTETIEAKGGWYLDLDSDGVPEFYPLSEWVRTSAKGTIRKNGASKGYTYNKTLDAFIAPKPSADATFDEAKAQWIVPIKQSTFNHSTTTP